jgi:hypothetical protein
LQVVRAEEHAPNYVTSDANSTFVGELLLTPTAAFSEVGSIHHK